MEQNLRRIVLERDLGDIIEITGRIPPEKMPQVYRQNDIYVSASMQEGMSNAMLEAMASALPIITTRCEGVEELIKDNGIVVESSKAEEIAKAIENLADDRKAYSQMSAAAGKQAESFGWDKVALSYIEQYRKILNL